ncbi:MAG: signal peptidase II [Clostridia bacterium]|nr:signal peptidase II [Clostridia bacterium]
MKKINLDKEIIAIPVVLLIDQLSKVLVEKNIYKSQIDILKNIFSFTYVENTGGAWGLLGTTPVLFLILVPIVVIAIFMAAMKSNNRLEKISWYMIIGGALGNYIDRLFRGYVVDFIDFHVWPVFNVADIFVVVGCILLIVSSLIKKGD